MGGADSCVSIHLQEFNITNVEKNMRNSSRRYDWSIAQLPITRYPFGKEAYSLIGFLVELKRNTNPFYTNTYLPTGLLTIISFIGFVIPVDMVPGRMALLVTIFLMLVNISTTERNRGPIVRTHPLRIKFHLQTT